jgi:predicted ATPase
VAQLTSLRLAGWKSIRDATIEPRSLNVMIGANGAGKSNVLSFFRFLRALFDEKADLFVGKEGGANALLHFGVKTTQRLTASLTVDVSEGSLTFETCLEHSQPDSLVVNPYPPSLHPIEGKIANNEKITNLSASGRIVGWVRQQGDFDGTAIVNSLLDQIRCCHFHDTSATAGVRLTGYIHDNQFLYEDARNLAAMLYLYRQRYPTAYHRIVAAVKAIAPFFDDFVLEPLRLNPRNIALHWRSKESDYEFGAHQLSDGTLRAIALFTLLLQPEEDLPELIVLDEPELGLHPAAMAVLADLLKSTAQRSQLIVATQSAGLIDHFEVEDIVTVNLRDGCSTFERLDPERLKHWLEEYTLSELWERNVIGGGPY